MSTKEFERESDNQVHQADMISRIIQSQEEMFKSQEAMFKSQEAMFNRLVRSQEHMLKSQEAIFQRLEDKLTNALVKS
ncbi:hypothetical protein MKW92_046978, partial [Papaver armeniacum]